MVEHGSTCVISNWSRLKMCSIKSLSIRVEIEKRKAKEKHMISRDGGGWSSVLMTEERSGKEVLSEQRAFCSPPQQAVRN